MQPALDSIHISTFLSKSSVLNWSSIITSNIGAYKQNPRLGRLFGLITLSTISKSKDCEKTGKTIQNIVLNSFYNFKGEVLEAAKYAIKKVKEELSILSLADSKRDGFYDLNIILVVVKDNVCYCSSFGNLEILLYRSSKLTKLTSYLKDLTHDSNIETLSILLQNDDKIMLATPESILKIIDIKITQCIEYFNFENLNSTQLANPNSKISILLIGYINFSMINEKIELERAPKEVVVKNDLGVESFDERVDQAEILDENLREEVVNEKLLKKKINIIEIFKKISQSLILFIKKLFSKENQITIVVLLRKIFFKINQFYRKLKISLLSRINNKGRLNNIYLKREKKKFGIVPIILIIIGIIIIIIVIKNISEQRYEEAKLNTTKIKITEAETLSNQAKLLTETNKTRSLELVSESNKRLDEAAQNQKLLEQIDIKRKENQAIIDTVNHTIVINDSNLYYDFGLSYSDFSAVNVFLNGSVIVIAQNNKIFISNTNSGDFKQIINSSLLSVGLKQINYSSIDYRKENIILYDKNSGLYSFNIKAQTLEKLSGLSDEVLPDVNAITNTKVGTQEYIYSIIPSQQTIKRMSKQNTGYSLPESRLVDVKLESAMDLDIDTKLYITTPNQIIRYLGSNIDNFTLNTDGLIVKPGKYSMFSLDSKYFYIADNDHKRLLIFSRDLNNNQVPTYLSSIEYRGKYTAFGNIKDVKSDSNGNLYIMDTKRLFKVALNITSD